MRNNPLVRKSDWPSDHDLVDPNWDWINFDRLRQILETIYESYRPEERIVVARKRIFLKYCLQNGYWFYSDSPTLCVQASRCTKTGLQHTIKLMHEIEILANLCHERLLSKKSKRIRKLYGIEISIDYYCHFYKQRELPRIKRALWMVQIFKQISVDDSMDFHANLYAPHSTADMHPMALRHPLRLPKKDYRHGQGSFKQLVPNLELWEAEEVLMAVNYLAYYRGTRSGPHMSPCEPIDMENWPYLPSFRREIAGKYENQPAQYSWNDQSPQATKGWTNFTRLERGTTPPFELGDLHGLGFEIRDGHRLKDWARELRQAMNAAEEKRAEVEGGASAWERLQHGVKVSWWTLVQTLDEWWEGSGLE